MRTRPAPLLVAVPLVVSLAIALTGCGLGTSAGDTSAAVLVTRDFGARTLGGRIVQAPPASDSVLRLLQRGFKVTTQRGGVGVEAIGAAAAHGPLAWSFYVNGIEGGKRAAHVSVHGGDRIWWDLHDERAAGGKPTAVVGSFPEPFLHGAGGKRYPVVLECADDVEAACTQVGDRLAAAGVRAVGRQALGTGVGQDTLRVFVGPWRELRSDAALAQIDRGPAVSGVSARFERGGAVLALLGQSGAAARRLGPGAGLVAATRFEQQAPTWAITGTDVAGVARAARALDEPTLRRRFALAIGPAGAVALPIAAVDNPASFRRPGR